MTTTPAARPAFGTVLADQMSIATYADGAWQADKLAPVAPIPMHPSAHVLHYASTCFEGFKAYRYADGSIHVFRMDRHIARLRQSARLLLLPVPDEAQLERMILQTIDRQPRAGAGAPGRAVHAAGAVRHDAEHRRGVAAVERSHADRAGEPGVGLLRGRHEAAAHLCRRSEAPHGRAPWHGQDGRQLCRCHGSDARGQGKVQDRPGPVLSRRVGAGNRRCQLPADPRRPHPHAQPRHDVPARRHA